MNPNRAQARAGCGRVLMGRRRRDEALARRRRPGAQDWLREMRGGRDRAADGEMDELRQTVERLNGDVAELQERVDFTERMLAQQRERPALPDR